MSGRHRARRSDSFAVRRWLQLGAASAGMGAAIWGMSLVQPQVPTAHAEAGGSPSSTESAPNSAGTEDASASPDADTTPGGTGSDETAPDESEADESEADDPHADDPEADDLEAEDDPADGATDGADPDTTTEAEAEPDPSIQDEPDRDTAAVVAPEATTSTATEPDSSRPTAAAPVPWAVKHQAAAVDAWQQNTSAMIAAATSNTQLLIDALAAPPPVRDALTGTLWTVRRALFNLAPTMTQSYSVTGGIGAISGQLAASDPEGDRLRYHVLRGPQNGTLTLSTDGTYIYTPAADFDGVDTFVITADDLGAHINLLIPFRSAGASSGVLVNQNAIAFDFTYDDPGGYFTGEVKRALNASAQRLAAYVLVNHKTVLTYSVKSEFTPGDYLATGYSAQAGETSGFWGSVVQHKLLTGVDANGSEVDGEIEWNWANDWGFYPSVGAQRYDFTSTVMHELLHSFGWLSAIDTPGEPEDPDNTVWYRYDRFVTTGRKISPIDDSTLEWDPAFDPYLTGFDGGMYFAGPNAMAAYGGRPVPLWTPAVWSSGSSIMHLDDDVFFGPNHALMASAAGTLGPDRITLSPVELGILTDLGYTVVPAPWFSYPPPAPQLPEPRLTREVAGAVVAGEVVSDRRSQ